MAADKVQELKEALAKQTGVKVEDVGKILDRLGLERSLRQRVSR